MRSIFVPVVQKQSLYRENEMLTQHQMVNIGIGNEPDTPLKYAVIVKHPELIGPLKTTLYAVSEGAAAASVSALYPHAEVLETYIM
jgi:hypothetical protein